MRFDISQVPFSRRGSRLAFARLPVSRAKELGKLPGLFLRTLAGGVAMERREVFRLDALHEGKPVEVTESATPSVLSLDHPAGKIEAVFAGEREVLLRGKALGLQLAADGGWYATLRPAGSTRWELNLFAQRIQLMLGLRCGRIHIDAPWHKDACEHIRIDVLPDESGSWEISIEEFRAFWVPSQHPVSFAEAISSSSTDFASWLEQTLPTSPALAEARMLAAYVNWSSIVSPQGHLQREAMLMSKNWMMNVWSWDHCFNAIALAKNTPSLAWDQWALLFDFQHSSGALPDCVNDAEIVWNFTKPPVHGWALREMMAQGLKLSNAQLEKAITWLSQWTHWWLLYRDEDGDGLANYNHGNDSGWDNATVTDVGPPIEGADLAAFLILQMEVLADLCQAQDQPQAAESWRLKAADHFDKLVAHSWRDGRFVCPRSMTHEVASGDSLVPYMPLLLGARLSPSMRECLVRGVQRFVTPHGVATECPLSPFYESDGYWRGPVWAPSTHLIVSGLRACGENRLASQIARAFLDTCAKSGFAENFDALTGRGLRDRAYTWTASVFLVLAEEESGLVDIS